MLKKNIFFIKATTLCIFLAVLNSSFTVSLPKDYYSMSIAEFKSLEKTNNKINISKPDYELLNAAVFHATNQQRLNLKRKVLKHSLSLEKSAMLHSSNMVKYNFFDHTDKKNKGLKEPEDRIMKSGGNYSATGENIHRKSIYNITAKADYTIEYENGAPVYYQVKPNGLKGNKYEVLTYWEAAQQVVGSWMKSPGHKANILAKEFTDLGCGSYIKPGSIDGEKMPELYITQNFGGAPGTAR